MKFTILILFLGLFQISFAQQLAYKSGGTIVTMSEERVSSGEVKKMMASYPEALALYKKGKNKQRLGNILILGGTGLAVGTFATAYVSDSDFSPVSLVGVAVAIAGIPIKIGYSDKIKSGIKTYNNQVAYQEFSPVRPELTFCANASGVGLKLTF